MENETQPIPTPQLATPSQPQTVFVDPQPQTNVIPSSYKPISAWGYVGYQLLFSIPLIGFIFMLVFAIGGTKNENVKNFAKSYLCWLLIGVIVGALAALFFLVMIILAGGFAWSTGA
ncbi:MAG: hypothetical protein J5892_03495 [Bacilli bacterium]|nr:hypothetical protein [Bacilli bacterium]